MERRGAASNAAIAISGHSRRLRVRARAVAGALEAGGIALFPRAARPLFSTPNRTAESPFIPDSGVVFAGPWGPFVIFGLRIIDVSLSTVRILPAVRGRKQLVPIIGFVEVLVWLFAAGNAIRNFD
jgi:hypothetical protein